MKKIFYFIIALVVSSSNAMALEYEPEEGLTWMGLFGMNISKLQNHPYNGKAGAMMGIRGDYMLPNAHGAYVTAGFDWTMKGGKLSYEDDIEDNEGVLIADDEDVTKKFNLHYVEIPIRAGFRYNVTEELGFFGEVGPYFAIGIGGRHKTHVDEDGAKINAYEDEETYQSFKNYGYPKETFQRWDAGIGVRVGAVYNEHYNLMFGCDWGLADMYRNSYRDKYKDDSENVGKSLSKVHNFNFSITLGYRF
jgi:hypothetical protein